MRPNFLNPDNPEQGHRYSFPFISVPISITFQKLNALTFIENKTIMFQWPLLNFFWRCHNSGYQILFCFLRGITNDIPEVTTKEEVPLTISAIRRHLDRIFSISNCPLECPYGSFSKNHNLRFVC
jgi:hypothetical protein